MGENVAISTVAIQDALVSHALSTGQFVAVNGHEPKKGPGNGTAAAFWVQALGPTAVNSGLDSTSAVLVFQCRIYANFIQEPQDAIDPMILDATDALMAAYSGDFTLGGLVRNVDLLGQAGNPLGAQAGYMEQDGKMYRVITLTIPLIINDTWEQEA